jgi:molybdopterin synthase catalytic subunit
MEITIQFTDSPIVIPTLQLPHREIGACVEFLGLVRELEQGRALPGLFYEAYLPMAERQMRRVFESLAAEHPCHSVLFIHRLEWVPVGESSIFLRVLASHRGEALALCGAAIDRMKQDAPIWKNLRVA